MYTSAPFGLVGGANIRTNFLFAKPLEKNPPKSTENPSFRNRIKSFRTSSPHQYLREAFFSFKKLISRKFCLSENDFCQIIRIFAKTKDADL